MQVFVLVNAGRTTKFKPETKTIRLLEKRYGHEINDIFGIDPAALTANEASYLVGFRTADEIRNRLAKARQGKKHISDCVQKALGPQIRAKLAADAAAQR